MRLHSTRIVPIAVACLLLPSALRAWPAQSRQSSSSSSAQHVRKPSSAADSTLDPGSVGHGVYRNQALAVACKIPPGWVLRTDEMNARPPTDDPQPKDGPSQDKSDNAPANKPAASGSVLLAAFSRPPEAAGEDVNSSIVIAAESSTSYPGLKDAAQYFGPLTEVATAQGFKVVNEPYEFLSGTKMLVRGDFAKDRGTRAMHQTTLVMLGRGYAVSFTFIGGTEDELEELIQGLSFQAQTSTLKQRP
jgi:hypothetical protein